MKLVEGIKRVTSYDIFANGVKIRPDLSREEWNKLNWISEEDFNKFAESKDAEIKELKELNKEYKKTFDEDQDYIIELRSKLNKSKNKSQNEKSNK